MSQGQNAASCVGAWRTWCLDQLDFWHPLGVKVLQDLEMFYSFLGCRYRLPVKQQGMRTIQQLLLELQKAAWYALHVSVHKPGYSY